MMRTNYQLLFSVETSHTYFENSVCDCLSFVPDYYTEQLLKRYGFMLNHSKNGFRMYVSAPAAVADFLQYISLVSGQEAFSFELVTKDPGFFVYTDLPYNELVQLSFDSSNVSATESTLTFNTGFAAGQQNSIVGTMTVAFEDILRYTTTAAPVFRIALNARSTQWQYYIVNTTKMPISNPGITGKNPASFSGPQTVTIESGQEAMLFVSEELLPLSEKPFYQFDFVSYPSNGVSKKPAPKMLFRGLPNAGAEYYATTTVNGAVQVCSPMYVYV